jgi:hypothetical protein
MSIIVDRLLRLKQMHDQGALSDEEYAELRRPLLEQALAEK